MTLVVSCSTRYETEDLELRQLVNDTKERTSASGGFFFIAGTYSSRSYTEITISVFAKVDGAYRYIKIPIERVRINIDNNIKLPTLKIVYLSDVGERDTETVLDYHLYAKYIINCPEIYLPEKLLPITLGN